MNHPDEWQPQNIPVDIRADDPNAVNALIEQYRQLTFSYNETVERLKKLEDRVFQ